MCVFNLQKSLIWTEEEKLCGPSCRCDWISSQSCLKAVQLFPVDEAGVWFIFFGQSLSKTVALTDNLES